MMLECENCGDDFKEADVPATIMTPRYCSDECWMEDSDW